MDIVFSKNWFQTHQRKLLWFLNTPVIKDWFRWILNIDYLGRINQITPNNYSYNLKKIGDSLEVTTKFSVDDKYAKKLYYSFKPFWYLLHFFDWAMLDRVEALSKLSFGFSTLTAQPGSIAGDNPIDCDYFQSGSDVSWGTIRGGAGTTANDGGLVGRVGYNHGSTSGTDKWARLYRAIFCFDTSSLTSSASISSAVLSLYGSSKANPVSIGNIDLNIYTSTPASTSSATAGDYAQVGSTAQCDTAITYTNFSTTGYNDFTLNATGIGNVSLTGISKFGTRTAALDVANTIPGGSTADDQTYMKFNMAANGSNYTKLVVTYTIAASASGNFLAFM